MDNKEIEDLSNFVDTMKKLVYRGGGAFAIGLVTFYFTTTFKVEDHEKRITKVESVVEDVIIIKNEIHHLNEHDETFLEQYDKDKVLMFEMLKDIKDNQ